MKKKKRIILLAVGVLLVVVWAARVYWINREYPDVERKTYAFQEEVELEKDIIDYDEMDGYFVTVKSAQIYEYDELLSEYGLENFTELYAPDRVYLLKILLRNTNNTETGVSFLSWYIQSDAVLEDLNLDLYYELNNLDSYDIALRENSEMEFLLPYNLREDFFHTSEWKNLEDYNMWLTVTWYPTKKMISLK